MTVNYKATDYFKGTITMKTLLFICICITLQQCMPFASSAPRQRRQLPCTHPLRLSAPQLFSHCDSAPCTYGSWSSWERVPGSVTPVPSSLCASEKAYTEQRTRVATGSGCNEPLRETQNICEFTLQRLQSAEVVTINLRSDCDLQFFFLLQVYRLKRNY